MILIYLIVILAQCSVFEANHYSQIDSINSCSYTNCSFTPNGHFRFIRQAKDPLDTTVDRMQTIARLTNAIYLQQGLLDESVLPYDVIAELLFFEDVKQDALNDPGIGKVFEEIKTLPETLTKDDKVEKSERLFDVLVKTKQNVKGVSAVDKWTLKDALVNDLEELRANAFDFTLLTELISVLNFIKMKEEEIESLLQSKREGDTKLSFDFVVTKTQEAHEKATKLSKSIDTIVKLVSGKNATASFSDIYKLSEAVNFFVKSRTGLTHNPDSDVQLTKNVDLISGLSKAAAQVFPFSESVHNIMQNQRAANKRRSLKFTSGFPDGYDELKSLSSVLSDQWLNEITGTDSFSKAFSPLEAFGERIEEISDGLAVTNNQKMSSMDNVHGFLENLVKSGSIPSEAKTIVEPMLKCHEPLLVAIDYPSIDLTASQGVLEKIDSKMTKLRSALKNVADFINSDKTRRILKEVGEIAAKATSNDLTLLKDVVNKFLSYTSKNKFNEMFTTFDKLTKMVDTGKIDPETVLNDEELKSIDDFIAKTLPKFKRTFECLQEQKSSDVEIVHRLALKSKDLKSPIADSLKQDMTQVTKLVGTLQKLKSTGDVIEEMKTSQNDESKALIALGIPSKHSETLGSASRGIVNFRDVIAEKPNIVTIQTRLQLVDDKLKPDLSQFQTMSDALNAWKTTVTLPDSQKLEDYSKIFLDAKSISGIDDVKKISDDVEKLQKSSTDPAKQNSLGELKKALDELNSIGLDFVRYQQSFGDSKDSLKALDLFFAKWRGILNPPSVATPTVVQSTPNAFVMVSSGAPQVESTTKAANSYSWVYWAIGIGLLFVIFVIILLLRWRKGYWFWNRKPEEIVIDVTPMPKPEDEPDKTTEEKAEESKEKTVVNPTEKPEKMEVVVVKNRESHSKSKQISTHQKPPEKKAPVEERAVVVYVELYVEPEAELPHDAYQKLINDIFSTLRSHQKKVLRIKNNEVEMGTFHHYAQTTVKNLKIEVRLYFRDQEYAEQNRYPIALSNLNFTRIQVHMAPRCHFKDTYLNGNCFTMPNNCRFFLTPTPMTSSKKKGGPQTVDKFLYFIAQTRSSAVVFISDKDEMKNGLRIDGKSTESEYGRYFPDNVKSKPITFVAHGTNVPLTLTCLKKYERGSANITHRLMRITYKDEKPPVQEDEVDDLTGTQTDAVEAQNYRQRRAGEHSAETSLLLHEDDMKRRKELRHYKMNKAVENKEERVHHEFVDKTLDINNICHDFDHFHFTGWSAKSVPEGTEEVQELLRHVQRRKNVVVHCSDGIERSGTFACIELFRQKFHEKMRIEHEPRFNHFEELKTLRQTRNGSMNSIKQFAFVIVTLVDIIKRNGHNVENARSKYEQLLKLYNVCLNPPPAVIVQKPLAVDATQEDDPEDPTQPDDPGLGV